LAVRVSTNKFERLQQLRYRHLKAVPFDCENFYSGQNSIALELTLLKKALQLPARLRKKTFSF